MILRARVVLPISNPPIQDGAVVIRGKRIAEVGRWKDLGKGKSSRSIDLGKVILMPGLVNSHCHLDYTHMAGQIPPPKSFIEWLKVIVSTKAGWTLADYRASWKEGAEMLVRTGTTTVADIEAVPQLLPDAWNSTPIRVISFLEMIGITRKRASADLLRESSSKLSELKHARSRGALSPHAPYSTLPDLLKLTARTAQRRRLLVSTHVSESKLEFEMFSRARGEMFDWLERSGRDMSDCGNGSPVEHLDSNGLLGENLLAVHLNYPGPRDIQLLADRKVTVVHCPRSHSYFRHAPFRLRHFLTAGVNVTLGTDSLASVFKRRNQSVELNMFEEMRAVGEGQGRLRPESIVRLATINGATALRMTGLIGELKAGAFADLIALPYSSSGRDPYRAVIDHRGPLSSGMIGGSWTVSPPGL